MAKKRVRVQKIIPTTSVPSESFIFTMHSEQNFKSLANSSMLLNHTTRNKSLVTSPIPIMYKKNLTSRQRVNNNCCKGFTASLIMQAVLIRL